MSGPYWMTAGLKTWPKAMQVADGVFSDAAQQPDLDLRIIPLLAVFHLGSCMETANFANGNNL